MNVQELHNNLNQTLPEIFGRSEIDNLFPGIISSKSQANLDSAGKGPLSYRYNRRVFYKKEIYLEWLFTKINKII